MALIPVQTMTQTGLTPSLQAASAGGDTYIPGNQTFLMIKNASGSPITVTIVTTATAFGQLVADVFVLVAAGATTLAGPYDPGEVAAPPSGLVSITYSGVTSLTIAAVQL
jgi:hypothetical protein